MNKLSEQWDEIIGIKQDANSITKTSIKDEVAQLEARCEEYRQMGIDETALLIEEQNRVAQLEADLEERTNQYHLAHAKISSRDAIIEQLSETQLAKDVADLESTIEEITKLAKEPIVNRANSEHDDALLRLVRIIEVLEEGNDGTK